MRSRDDVARFEKLLKSTALARKQLQMSKSVIPLPSNQSQVHIIAILRNVSWAKNGYNAVINLPHLLTSAAVQLASLLDASLVVEASRKTSQKHSSS